MNNKIIASMGILGVLTLAVSVSAQNVTPSLNASLTSWTGAPIFETGPAPTTGSGGTTQDNDSWGGNANGTGGFGALGQAFTVTSAGTLANVQLVVAGSPATFNVELYDMGATPAGYQAAAGNPPTITQINNIGGGAPSGTPPTISGGTDLLQAGDSFSFTGVASGQDLLTLAFGGADASVQLNTGELYVLALDPTGATADNTWWVRGGVPISAYNTGEGLNADGVAGYQDFESKSSVRDFDLGVDVAAAPEPTSMALMGMGASLTAFIARRRSLKA